MEEHGATAWSSRVRLLLSSTHCGGGCTLGDIVAETLVFVLALSIAGATISTARVPVSSRFGNVHPSPMPHRILWNSDRIFQKRPAGSR